MLTALTRGVSPNLESCELEFFERKTIDVARAVEQHRAYENALAGMGARVISLPANPGFPDGMFVEDPAIVLDEIAIICRLGSEVRRRECASIAEALGMFRDLKWMAAPATLEGGDVMRIGKTLHTGVSRRSNRQGSNQLAELIEPYGYRVVPVAVSGCLHLKTAVCSLGDATLLANREWFEADLFRNFEIIDVPPDEPCAANVLRIGETVLIPSSFPKTRERLEHSGFKVLQIDISELQKAEAGLTCSSLIFEADA
jgi:dimethylargininase